MKNLTEIALKNKDLVWYFIIITFIAGIVSYVQLGRMEDPPFTIRQMIVSASWPGASAQQMEEQVTDKLEKKIQDTVGLDYVKSYSSAGSTVIYVNLRQDVDNEKIRQRWQEVRNLCEDEKGNLPEGVYGPYYNDRFDDVYGSIYAVTGEGYSYEDLRKNAEKIRRLLLSLPNVQKISLLGEQTEKVYIEVENHKLAELGISPEIIANAIKTQNEMTPTGMVETKSDNIYLRITGKFKDIDAIKDLPINAGGKVLRLGDIAKVERRYSEPADPKMFFNGKPAVGVAVSMEPGGNILTLGDRLNDLIGKIKDDVPLGIEINKVSDQPAVVKDSISEFVSTLRESIIIVLVVSFLSLGVRSGLVVAGCIPLVLAGVFCGMYLLGIDLQKISLGSLIIALGLLVDDAIIAVEMMSVKLEEGYSRFDAACYAFRATAKPMLTGTLITCAGFIPVAFSKGMASEFCKSLFPVIAIALLLSWIISVMVAPLFGYYLIRIPNVKEKDEKKSISLEKVFYGYFKKMLIWCLNHRKLVIGLTIFSFIGAIFSLKFVRQEFFPPSLRPEILVALELPEGASLKASEDVSAQFSEFLNETKNEIDNYSYYVGEGAPRFVLTTSPKLPTDNYAQFVIVAKDVESREDLTKKIKQELAEKFPSVRTTLKFIQTGPPADYPIMLRVSGYDKNKVRELAGKVSNIVSQDPNNENVTLDWNEKSKVLHLILDQDKLRTMGITGQSVSNMLYMELSGMTVAQYYAGDRTVNIDLRLKNDDRQDLSKIKDIPIYLGSAGYVPLEQVAKITFEAEDGLIWRRNLKPTITVQADIKSGTANDATQKIYDETNELRNSLPLGYSIEVDGALSDSQKAIQFLSVPVPIMILVIITLLMFQLRDIKLVILTLCTAPLGLIGVGFGMLITDKSMGFVAQLGILALSGMIIRNSVILIDQIKKHLAEGEDPWDAVIDSAVLRFRPIMLTAAAAILGMIPLMKSTFWGPMAVAIASGLLIATILTLLVLPTMYAICYKIKK
ncbi:Multidrug efflux pump subunit AcrB [Propionispira arboris]|uniref:Multidrug efflux pump subunit AcrB n=1 Tax=Propionispira arboris TaxID=84035 RepID=A0A1H6WLS7_9FIRM|nr:efflux RND transporter permease subunit [Propionispira arboris]SEJ17981.1 Multidrug efflux pump subunit AcrB [Propionispira arboris]